MLKANAEKIGAKFSSIAYIICAFIIQTEVFKNIWFFSVKGAFYNYVDKMLAVLTTYPLRWDFLPYKIVTDWIFGWAELLLCGSAQMTEPFSAENMELFFHITFNANGILSYFCFAQWPICTQLNSQKNTNRAKIGIKLFY